MASTILRDIDTGMSCLFVETVVCGYHVYKVLWESRVGETLKHSSLCAKLILNRDQIVKYLGFPLPELEIIYPICAKDAEKLEMPNFYKIYGIPCSRKSEAVELVILRNLVRLMRIAIEGAELTFIDFDEIFDVEEKNRKYYTVKQPIHVST